MALVNFTNLDFDQIRTSIKDYLRSNSSFTDYDFEGSNMSILIDMLAYNTYINSYNANMLSNEVFLDSATLRENVVSLAKNVGYLPRSATSSKAVISFFVDVSEISPNSLSLTLNKGTICSSRAFVGDTFSFSIPAGITVPIVGGIATFNDIEIYEGPLVTSSFIVDSLNKNQKFILDNTNIDIATLKVNVRESIESSISTKYKFVDNLINVKSTDNIFFLNEIANQKYELIFGDGTFGSKLNNNNYIEASYVVSNGQKSNGVSDFIFTGTFSDNNGDVIQTETPFITTVEPSSGGKPAEEISSIKKFAPRVYASQNRAVTSSDYESLIPLIYPEVESISVFGGEELDPPSYGKVFIAIKPKNGSFVPSSVKDNLKSKLKAYSVAGIVPEFVDLKYLYIEYNTTIYYNFNLTRDVNDVKNKIFTNLVKYSKSTELNRYSSRFKYSKFLKLIDDSDRSITSNITKISMRRDLRIETSRFAEYEICFGNEFYIKNKEGYNIKSSGVNINGISGTVYFGDKPDSDGLKGSIFIFRLTSTSQPSIVRQNVGTIDYVKGEIRLFALNITNGKQLEGNTIIEFSAIPKSNDIIGKQDLYLQLDTSNSSIQILEDTISSGRDVSGSQYIVTSSYLNGDLVRN